MNRGRTLAAIAVLGAVAALGFLLGRGQPTAEESPTPDVRRNGAPPNEERSVPPRLVGADRETRPGAAGGIGPTGERGTVKTPDASEPPQARIEVTVIRADGTRVDQGTVYALPAGGRGTADRDSIPHADLPDPIPVPTPGSWDVGFTDGCLGTLVPGVVVRSGETARVTATLPDAAPITFHWAGGERPRVDRQTWVALWLDLGPDAPWYPGRGETGFPYAAYRNLDASQPSVQLPPLPRGRSWKFGTKVWEMAGDPVNQRESDRFDAEVRPVEASGGDQVAVRLVPLVPLRLSLAASEDGWPDSRISLEIVLSQGDVTRRLEVSFERASYFLAWTRTTPVLGARPGPATLTWSGRPFESGRLEGLRVPEDGGIDVGVVLRPDVRLPPPDAVLPIRLDGARPLASGAPKVWLLGRSPREGGQVLEDLDVVLEAGQTEVPSAWRTMETVVALQGDDRASDPTPVPASGELLLRLRPGGLVVVVIEDLVPEKMGSIRLRHEDGRLLPREDNHPVPECEAFQGLVLGPFPEGSHRFRATSAAGPLPDAVVEVRAGRAVPLVIRR